MTMELIDRNELFKRLLNITITADLYGQGLARGIDMACDLIKAANAVDAVPIIHAQWIDSPNISECVVCSNCMSDNLSAQVIAPASPWYKYCSFCGARMDGERKEGAE